MTKLIIGCGYLGGRVAQQWVATGNRVVALTRSPRRAAELAGQGIQPLVGDITLPATLPMLPQVDTVLYSVGWDPTGGQTRRQIYVDGLDAVLAVLPLPQRMLFISSTGVYGNADGQWVDEQTACRPSREAGKALWEAEQRLSRHPIGQRTIVLRMAGMYGPGRLMRQADLLAGRPIALAADSYLNLIHIDDAVAAVVAAETRGLPPNVYLVCDGQPADRREYFRHVAQLLGAAVPQFVEPTASERGARHDGSSKRVQNFRLLNELGVRLKYPSFREGLAAILSSEGRADDTAS
jgi:nucleoside-diphosphate-sugar epimerase